MEEIPDVPLLGENQLTQAIHLWYIVLEQNFNTLKRNGLKREKRKKREGNERGKGRKCWQKGN